MRSNAHTNSTHELVKNDDVIIWPSVDTVPRAFVEKFIRTTQARLKKRTTTKQHASILSFTTAGEGLYIYNDAFIIAALPFSRMYSKDTTRPTQGRRRTSSPLFTRLADVLSLLTSGPHALRILSMSNASLSHANALDAHAMALEYDSGARCRCIRAVGVEGWREERLYARWEAALLRAGMLTRWVVLVEVKD